MADPGGGGGRIGRGPPFFGRFFFFSFFLFTPKVGLVGGWYPYPIMTEKKIQEKKKCVGVPPPPPPPPPPPRFSGLAQHLDSWPSLFTYPGSATDHWSNCHGSKCRTISHMKRRTNSLFWCNRKSLILSTS